MPIDPLVKKNWEEIQKKHEVPVNAIGARIDSRDREMLKVWKENGIDRFVKQ